MLAHTLSFRITEMRYNACTNDLWLTLGVFFQLSCPLLKVQKLEIIKIFYKDCKDVGMAYKGQKQVKAVTQWSLNHHPYIQGCRTIRCDILACRDHG